MIRVTSVTIHEFRGIRNLTLNFNGKSFAVCGPNGTGKSGVVDALEFVFTGNISRLSGRGSGVVSLRDHAPHVDSRNAPEKARVTVNATIPSLGKTVAIERSVSAPHSPTITPVDPNILEVLQYVEEHPEFVLSRRELIRYIIATPGDRAQEVQTLLKLEQIEEARKSLVKIANDAKKQVPLIKSSYGTAADNLLKAAGLSEFNKDALLSVANTQRGLLGLQAIYEITDTTSLKDGMVAVQTKNARVPKQQALEDIEDFRSVLKEATGAETNQIICNLEKGLGEIATNPAIAAGLTSEDFYMKGLELLEGEVCPFCGEDWDPVELRRHVQEKRDKLKEAAEKRKELTVTMSPLVDLLDRLASKLDNLQKYSSQTTTIIQWDAVRTYRDRLVEARKQLIAFLPIQDTIYALKVDLTLTDEAIKEIAALDLSIKSIPDQTKQDLARDWLTLCQERLEVFREASRKLKIANDKTERAKKILETYTSTSDRILQGLYRTVQDDFAKLYKIINTDDEASFAASLEPSSGKLGFDVDFYGRGSFPPGAYHSEGHQDGMGLCLYLALMRHILGSNFTFAVLDDVLMSVDSGHRREVCKMLKQEFPSTQFILTTHDRIWLKHMKTESLIGDASSIEFRTWDVDHGPTEWEGRSVWEEIEKNLKENDVHHAASLLRTYMEYESHELCHRLRASVQFRADAQHQLGDLLPPATSQLTSLYKKAKEAAKSWGHSDVEVAAESLKNAFGQIVSTSQAEQWQINPVIHYNSWENLTKEEFAKVVEAFKVLINGFRCDECRAMMKVIPERGDMDTLTCDCGKVSFKLRNK